MNNLASNIRFLRKNVSWSQEELAKRLDVKRSSIAAYESKNVEPRLRTMLEIAKLFDINLSDLIEKDISVSTEATRNFKMKTKVKEANKSTYINTLHKDSKELKAFVDTTVNVKKMLEGLKIFYRFKTHNITENTQQSDVDRFIFLIEHLLNKNEALINTMTKRV